MYFSMFHVWRFQQSNTEGCSNDQLIDEILRLGNHSNEVIQVDTQLERNEYGFGLALSGHKNRNMMGTFICGLHPKGAAAEEGSLHIGDELVKVIIILNIPHRYKSLYANNNSLYSTIQPLCFEIVSWDVSLRKKSIERFSIDKTSPQWYEGSSDCNEI